VGAVRALIVEDELKMAKLLSQGLSEEGYTTDVAPDGELAIKMASDGDYDVIVLDVMLPGVDGFEVCRRLRGSGVRSPALMLTARDAVEDRAAGLDAGADDYLPKPFSFDELNARLRALQRRGPMAQPVILEVGDLRMDPRSRQVWRGDAEIDVSQKAFALLEILMRRPGEVVSRFDLLEHAWDRSYENRSNIVDVYIKYLRRRIDRPFGVRSIETVRRAGYRLRRDGGARG
jgi:two-component system, OmpR family, response regulator